MYICTYFTYINVFVGSFVWLIPSYVDCCNPRPPHQNSTVQVRLESEREADEAETLDDVETEDLWIETLVKTVENSYGLFQEQGINQWMVLTKLIYQVIPINPFF